MQEQSCFAVSVSKSSRRPRCCRKLRFSSRRATCTKPYWMGMIYSTALFLVAFRRIWYTKIKTAEGYVRQTDGGYGIHFAAWIDGGMTIDTVQPRPLGNTGGCARLHFAPLIPLMMGTRASWTRPPSAPRRCGIRSRPAEGGAGSRRCLRHRHRDYLRHRRLCAGLY